MRKIFIVEDDQGIREILEILLISENYAVKSFATAGEFADRDINDIPDLYLFDVMLPDGSGINLCRQIKQDKSNKGIPVFVMSAHANLKDMKDLCQPDGLIAKPFDIDNILDRIRMVLK